MPSARLMLIACFVAIVSSVTGLACYAGTVSNTEDDGSPGSIRYEIQRAAAGDTIDFDQSVNGGIINLNGASLTVGRSLTITAASLSKGITISGNGGNFSVFWVTGGPLTLENLTVTGSGPSTPFGGGVNTRSGAALIVNNCRFIGNQATGDAGMSIHGPLTMSDSTISQNTCGRLGVGGVDVVGPYLATISNCNITGNTGGDGGLNASGSANLTVINTHIDSNFNIPPLGTGGGYYVGVTVSFDNCTINGNTGTAIKGTNSSHLTFINNCDISDNTGLGIQCLNGSDLTMADCQVSRNQSAQSAIQIDPTGVQTRITNTIIDSNSGIGLVQTHSAAHQTILDSCTITNNVGGIRNVGGQMRLNRCTVSTNNSASVNTPGGIINTNGNMTLEETTISDNRAQTGAGILSQSTLGGSSTLTLNYSTVSGNEAISGEGGGISAINQAAGVNVSLNNCTISGNRANRHGGGIYFAAGSSLSNLRLIATTITQNQVIGQPIFEGGGVHIQPNPNARVQSNSSLFALNTDPLSNAPDFSGSVETLDYNLLGIVDGSFGFSGAHDQMGSSSEPLDPVIDPVLNDNGGPTYTHAVLAGSPTIRGGDPALVNTRDQRGVNRDNPPTIGAYEYVAGGGPGRGPGNSGRSGDKKPYKGYVRKP